MGFRVVFGEVAREYSKKGFALFARSQVEFDPTVVPNTVVSVNQILDASKK